VDVNKTLDNKEVGVGIFLNLTKATDVVNNDILLQKIDTYGIRGIAHQLFISYPKNRKQMVEIDCMHVTTDAIQQKWSEEKTIQYGVAQVSILGSLLFLIHVNDKDTNLSNDTGIKLTLSADDTSILITV
jgi:hypothetical protein